MVLYPNPANAAQTRYNNAQRRTRSTVERMFGIWKRRFPCLQAGLRIKLSTALTVIVATAVLHNAAVRFNDPVPPVDEDIILPDDFVDPDPPAPQGNRTGNAVRLQITEHYFTN